MSALQIVMYSATFVPIGVMAYRAGIRVRRKAAWIHGRRARREAEEAEEARRREEEAARAVEEAERRERERRQQAEDLRLQTLKQSIASRLLDR